MSIRSAWEEMVGAGLLVPTGEMRRNRKGELEPVYVLSEKGKAEAKRAGLDARKAGTRGGATADEAEAAMPEPS